jgi:hypothetical protein
MSDFQSPAFGPNETQQEVTQQHLLDPEIATNFIDDQVYGNVDYSSVESSLSTIFHVGSSMISDFSDATTLSLDEPQRALKSPADQCQGAQLQSMHIQRVLLQNSLLSKDPLSVPTPTGPVAGLLFASRAQATQAFLQRQVPHDWQPLRNDLTIPQTQADRNRYVAQLKTAMVDISQ